jgi:hypothetical protein
VFTCKTKPTQLLVLKGTMVERTNMGQDTWEWNDGNRSGMISSKTDRGEQLE